MDRGGGGAVAPSGRSACEIKLYNVTCTVDLGTPLDLKKIHQKTRNSEYNPRRFCAVIIRLRKPKTTALVFSTGKLVCTGATSPAQVKEAARRFAWMIKKLGFQNVKFRDFKIQNMLGTTYVGFPIRLEGLSLHHVEFCSYEPEIFAGLVYKMHTPKICLLIFVSGKVVLTGGKSKKDLEDALTNIYPVLQEFQKKQ